jgi:hypothetical protein
MCLAWNRWEIQRNSAATVEGHERRGGREEGVKRKLAALVSTSCKLDDVKKVTGVRGNYRAEEYCSLSSTPQYFLPQWRFCC